MPSDALVHVRIEVHPVAAFERQRDLTLDDLQGLLEFLPMERRPENGVAIEHRLPGTLERHDIGAASQQKAELLEACRSCANAARGRGSLFAAATASIRSTV